MQYDKGKHCTFYHRYHLVWITKYRFKVLSGDVRLRVREIIRQVCAENRVEIIKGVLAGDHVHMFVSIPPSLSVSDLMRKMKGRSSHKVQREFPQLKKRYWGRHSSFLEGVVDMTLAILCDFPYQIETLF